MGLHRNSAGFSQHHAAMMMRFYSDQPALSRSVSMSFRLVKMWSVAVSLQRQVKQQQDMQKACRWGAVQHRKPGLETNRRRSRRELQDSYECAYWQPMVWSTRTLGYMAMCRIRM